MLKCAHTQSNAVRLVKQACFTVALLLCATAVTPVMAHPGHGKPIDNTRSAEVMRHYLTEPVHLLGASAAILVAVACSRILVRRSRSAA